MNQLSISAVWDSWQIFCLCKGIDDGPTLLVRGLISSLDFKFHEYPCSSIRYHSWNSWLLDLQVIIFSNQLTKWFYNWLASRKIQDFWMQIFQSEYNIWLKINRRIRRQSLQLVTRMHERKSFQFLLNESCVSLVAYIFSSHWIVLQEIWYCDCCSWYSLVHCLLLYPLPLIVLQGWIAVVDPFCTPNFSSN